MNPHIGPGLLLAAVFAALASPSAAQLAGDRTPAPRPAPASETSPPTIASVESYVISYDGRPGTRGDGPDRTKSVLEPCADAPPRPPTASCWRVAPLASGSSLVEAIPVDPPGRPRAPATSGAAWDEAYRIQRETGARRVEPLFLLDLSSWERDDLPRTRSSLDGPDKPAAGADCEWSLKQIDVFAAWKNLRNSGRKPGEEGAGVFVAHPDTGYRQHAETWNADEAKSPVTVRFGYNFLASSDDPLDELDTTGLIPTPGHGTKSGSVIASLRGKQWNGGGPGDCVSGVAPGARLVPLRVSRSVVLISQRNLARAILEAVGDDRTLVKAKTQVISISMGGVPSWSLWQAVRAAEQKGVIVVAAAGNYVGTVVWPARFRETIAVSACNVECGTWTWSSHGSRVDISAPGESVWRADSEPGGKDSVGMGSGTTFATATVAGVAALWLDSHRSDAKIEALRRSGQLTEAFRRLLKSTSWRPDRASPARPLGVSCANGTRWSPGEYGTGIVDAARVVSAPIPALPRSRALDDAADEGTLPLFGSLFDGRASAGTIRARYAKLLGKPGPSAARDIADLEGEVLFHYAMDGKVRAALEALTSKNAPSESAYRHARTALLATDLSERLRETLAGRDRAPGSSDGNPRARRLP